jgi:hypothetical protein
MQKMFINFVTCLCSLSFCSKSFLFSSDHHIILYLLSTLKIIAKLLSLHPTSVNLVHNALVELPPARSFPAHAGPPCPAPPPPPARVGPPCQLGNNCHRKQNHSGVCLTVRAVSGNCPDRQTDRHHCSFDI